MSTELAKRYHTLPPKWKSFLRSVYKKDESAVIYGQVGLYLNGKIESIPAGSMLEVKAGENMPQFVEVPIHKGLTLRVESHKPDQAETIDNLMLESRAALLGAETLLDEAKDWTLGAGDVPPALKAKIDAARKAHNMEIQGFMKGTMKDGVTTKVKLYQLIIGVSVVAECYNMADLEKIKAAHAEFDHKTLTSAIRVDEGMGFIYMEDWDKLMDTGVRFPELNLNGYKPTNENDGAPFMDDEPSYYVLTDGRFVFFWENTVPGMGGEPMQYFEYVVCSDVDNQRDPKPWETGISVNYGDIKPLLSPEDLAQHEEERSDLNNSNDAAAHAWVQ